jgi:hypothetical protein
MVLEAIPCPAEAGLQGNSLKISLLLSKGGGFCVFVLGGRTNGNAAKYFLETGEMLKIAQT